MTINSVVAVSNPAHDEAVLGRLRHAIRHAGGADVAEGLAQIQQWLGGEVEAIEQALGRIEDELSSPLPNGRVDRARLAARHLLQRPGKRVRPLCVLLAARLGLPADPTKVQPLAVAAELVHAATLLHDDVIDEGVDRRGAPAARRIFGNSVSVLAGDHLLVRALRMVHATGVAEALPRLLAVIDEMVTAESVQLVGRITPVGDRDVVLSVIRGKTASLFRWSMEVGGMAAGLPEAGITALGTAGMAAGVAFQLVDDVLDLSGDAALLGKETLADLREGKLTWPVVVALERDPHLLDLVRAAADEGETGAAARSLVAGIRRTEALQETVRFAQAQAEVATAALRSVSGNPARRALEVVIDAFVARVL